jgi:phosphoribosylformylglycinamidine synthase
MTFSGGRGAELYLGRVPKSNITRNDYLLFSESNSRFLIEVSEKHKDQIETLMKGTPHSSVGRVKRKNRLSIYGITNELIVEADLAKLRNAWKSTFGD